MLVLAGSCLDLSAAVSVAPNVNRLDPVLDPMADPMLEPAFDPVAAVMLVVVTALVVCWLLVSPNLNTELKSVFDFPTVVDAGKLNVTFSGVLVEFSLVGSSSGGNFKIESFALFVKLVIVDVGRAGSALDVLVRVEAVAGLSTVSLDAPLDMNGDVTL